MENEFLMYHVISSQGPIKTLKNVATKTVIKATDSTVDCPLMFDDTRYHIISLF